MGINADQANKIVDAFKVALNTWYGSSVATLKQFQDSRRKTYMQKLEEVLDAPKLRKLVADSVQELGTAKGVVTRLENEKNSKIVETRARHDAELALLKQKQAEEINKQAAHYEPSILEAKVIRDLKEKDLESTKRIAYFTGLGQEDDGRSLYRNSEIGVDTAIRERVDQYMTDNLDDDPEGQKVLERIKQTDLVSSLAYFEKNVETMRVTFLSFIKQGILPPVTIMAWKIKDGKDISE
jgi:hypothetical protein